MSTQPLIVVVDDDPGMRWAVDALIRSLDYRTALFASAEEFLASGVSQQCSCLISDVNMGGMTGIELVSRLGRNASGDRHPPIILISAFTTPHMAEAARSAGALSLLKKPFDAEGLISLIELAIASSRLAATQA